MERDTPVASQQTERGAALFLALFALTAIGYASLHLIRHASAYAQLLRTQRDGIEHQNELRSHVTPLSSGSRRCEVQRLPGRGIAGAAPHSQDWHVCALEQPPFLSNQPPSPRALRPDYAAIFKAATPCPSKRANTALTTFDTPHAHYTCTLPSRIEKSLVVIDNIDIGATEVSSSSSQAPITIATPGSLVVSTRLTLSGNTLILAGGDVSIPLLTLATSDTAVATILSAHGTIAVDRVEGAIALTALGRRAISVPPTAHTTTPILPTSRGPSVAGIVPR